MKVIDKTVKNNKANKEYQYGDILKCRDDGDNDFYLYQISKYPTSALTLECAILIHDCEGDMSNCWRGAFSSTAELISSLKLRYDYVVKVKAHIVIDEVLSEGEQ